MTEPDEERVLSALHNREIPAELFNGFHAETDPHFCFLHEVPSSHLLSMGSFFISTFQLKAFLKECEKPNMCLQLVQTFC